MLRRIVLMLTTAVVMVAMMIATAVPAFAGGGATSITGFNCNVVDSDLSTKDTTNSKSTVTPSGNINQHCHYHPPNEPI